MNKPGKVLKRMCKKLGVRLTVKRGKKRVYKSIKVLKRQCANKKKKKVKRKRRKKTVRRRFGTTLVPPPYVNTSGEDDDYYYETEDEGYEDATPMTEKQRQEIEKVPQTIPMSAKQRIKQVSVQTGIPYKQLLMYILGAGALGGGGYAGYRYYKKRKKTKKRKRKFGSSPEEEEQTQRQEPGNNVPSSPEVFVEEEQIHGYPVEWMQESPPPASGQNTPLSPNLYHDDDDVLPVTPPQSFESDQSQQSYNTPFEEAQRRSLSPSPSSDDNNNNLEKLDKQRKKKRDIEKGNSSGFDPDGASNRKSSTSGQVFKRQKMFAAAEKRRIYNLITKAVKANEALNNVLRQRESNKKIPMINELQNFHASSREVLQNLGGNYRYIGRRDDRLNDRGMIFVFRGIDWNTNRVYLSCGEINYRMNFQYFLENFSKMNNNFGRRRKRKRKKVKRKRKKVKRKRKKVKRKRKKVKRKRKQVKRKFGRKVAKRSNEKLWRRIQQKYYKSNKGGKPGQWSARKAQLAVQEYKKKGGKYVGNNRKKTDLHKWTKEDWGTRSGRPSIQGKKATGERYLPRKARKALSKKEYKRTTAAKRRGIKKGKQFVRQPKKIAKKTAKYRKRKKVKRKRKKVKRKRKKVKIKRRK